MTSSYKINLIYQYLFSSEVKYSNRVQTLRRNLNYNHADPVLLLDYILAQRDCDVISKVQTDIFSLLNERERFV